MHKQTIASRLRLLALATLAAVAAAAGCASSDPPTTAQNAEGAIEFCSDTVDVSRAIKTVALDGKRVASTTIDVDPVTGILRPTTTTYECNCDGGTGDCYPTFNGTALGCTSMTCTTCKLSKVDTGASGLRAGAQTCGGPFTDAEEDALAIRVAEIEAWTRDNGLPQPRYIDDEAIAPDGYQLAIESAGRRELAYVVKLGGSGPIGANGTPEQLFRPKARCSCSGDSGRCSFAGIVCQGTCSDNCQITVRGASGQ